jgi:hypothetical protein
LIEAFGIWGQRWVEAEPSLEHLDVGLLMWDMRRNLDPSPMPEKRSVIHFQYPEQPASQRIFWLIVEPETDCDLCAIDPGFEVDLYVSTDLHTMTAIWMGVLTVAKAGAKVALTGDQAIGKQMQTWLGLSPFAVEPKRAA